MMRKLISVALMASLACALGLARGAGASVTIDLIWDDTGTPTLTITPGDTSHNWPRSLGVIMTTSTRLISAGTSILYPTTHGLAVDQAVQWWGYRISQGVYFLPVGSPTDDGVGKISSFASIVPTPNAPPSAPPGVYRIGTVWWDTSATAFGQDIISPYTDPLFDGYSNGDGNLITGVETLHSATLNIIPEPATVSLLGLGLVGLLLTARRRKSEG